MKHTSLHVSKFYNFWFRSFGALKSSPFRNQIENDYKTVQKNSVFHIFDHSITLYAISFDCIYEGIEPFNVP
ncbi:hypothetical protein OIU76_001732 [Salix suchowensis]|nr:hypothetical protein OIU76_001732 [Salix suchowensis]